MRIISLHQPFATLMMLGLKTNETRNRLTHVRGELGIASCAKIPKYCQDLLDKPFFCTALNGIDLPTGCILGTVEVTGCTETHEWIESMIKKELKGDEFQRFQQEIMFGDYNKGRYAWHTTNPKPFDKPIPAKGSQGFWFFDTPKINARTGQVLLF